MLNAWVDDRSGRKDYLQIPQEIYTKYHIKDACRVDAVTKQLQKLTSIDYRRPRPLGNLEALASICTSHPAEPKKKRARTSELPGMVPGRSISDDGPQRDSSILLTWSPPPKSQVARTFVYSEYIVVLILHCAQKLDVHATAHGANEKINRRSTNNNMAPNFAESEPPL
jgi:hypothetical protein